MRNLNYLQTAANSDENHYGRKSRAQFRRSFMKPVKGIVKIKKILLDAELAALKEEEKSLARDTEYFM